MLCAVRCALRPVPYRIGMTSSADPSFFSDGVLADEQGRVVLGTPETIICFDAISGKTLWSRPSFADDG